MIRNFLLFALAIGANAAERKLPRELQPVLQVALAAPPEFAADALLRLVESNKIADHPTSIELLQQAFDLAGAAHFRVAMRSFSNTQADTRQGALAKAYGLKLDALSLQSRAVQDMATLDGTKARQMFAAIPNPELPALTCDDSLVYDVEPYYRALSALLQLGFTAKERDKEDHVAFLLEYVAQAHSAAQLAPMAEVLKSANVTPAQREAVAVRFSGQLETVSGDDRSFSASVNRLGDTIAPEMSSSFTKYVDKHLGAKRCEENVRVTARFGGTEGAKVEGAAKVDAYWQSSAAQQLMDGGRKLRFGNAKDKVLSDTDRASSEWQQNLADYEKQLASWTAASEKSETDYYQQKCIVYQALVELIPPGAERDKALESFLSFIAGSNLQSQSPVEWFVPAQAMLERIRNTNNGEPEKILAAYERSGNPVLVLHAVMERVFGGRASFMPPETSSRA